MGEIVWLILKDVCVWRRTSTISAPNTVKLSMVNIILSTVCIFLKKNLSFWQVFEACTLKSKPKKGWAAMGVLSGILESLCQPAVEKPKRHMKFWVESCPKGLSQLAHPLPGSRCYTASPLNPLCIHSNPLCILFWPGFFCHEKGVMLPHYLPTRRYSCAGSDQKLPASAQGKFLEKSIRRGKVIAWDTPMSLWLQGFLSQRWCFLI